MTTARYMADRLPDMKAKPAARKPARVLAPPKGASEIKAEIHTLQELAAELGIGPIVFHRILRDKGILREDNLPTSAYFKQGLLIVEKVPYAFSSGFIGFLHKARVTRKGMAFFMKMFRELAA